jgi:hypothetical protein
MSDYSWFRLLLRAIGVLLLGLSVPMLLWTAGAAALTAASAGGRMSYEPLLAPVVAYGGQAAIGLYLLLGGQLLVDYCLQGVRGRCGGCGYDLSGLDAQVCPECGAPIPRRPVH